MHPVLFQSGNFSIYSYGVLIAIGAILGVIYMAVKGKRETGLTFDQANALFLYIFIAAFVGGKFFLFFEDPSSYMQNPKQLLTGRGFVFYGSFLFAIPTMLWFFRKHKLNTYMMLDVMAITTCVVHIFGRLGCFMAGCCHGIPTDSALGVTFVNELSAADPKGVPLHPTQLYEAFFILILMFFLLWFYKRRQFYGQLFLLYLLGYAAGRFVLEFFRGDVGRGFIIEDYISHSQLIAIGIFLVVVFVYMQWSKRNPIALKQRVSKTKA